MSIAPLKEIDEKELDILGLLISIWRSKLFIAIFSFLSLPISLYIISTSVPMYKAFAVIEVADNNSAPGETSGSIAMLQNIFTDQTLSNEGSVSLIPKILGNQFLTDYVLTNKMLKDYIDKNCRYVSPGLFSITGFLDATRIYSHSSPTKDQLVTAKIDCIKKMLSIQRYKYGKIATPAFTVIGLSKDADFSANLVNEVVRLFFESERFRKEAQYAKTMKYLAELIASAQIELENAKKDLEQFVIGSGPILYQNNLMGTMPNLSSQTDQPSVMRELIKKRTLRVEELKVFQNDLNITLQKIKKLAGLGSGGIITELEKIETSKGLSNEFIVESRRLLQNEITAEQLNQRLSDRVAKEIDRLNRLIDQNEVLINEQNQQLVQFIEINAELTEKENEIVKKAVYYNSLQDQLTAKTFEAGITMLKESFKYSFASPPLYAESPKKKEIIILFAIIFLVLSLFIVSIRQVIVQTIFTKSQLKGISSLGIISSINFYRRFYSLLNVRDVSRGSSSLTISMMDRLSATKKIGCIVDLSDPLKVGNSYANEITGLVADIVSKDHYKTLSVGCKERNSVFSLIQNKNLLIRNKEDINGDTLIKNKTNLMVERPSELMEQLFPISSKLREFDKILFPLPAYVDDVEKFEIMQKVDFYIFIGEAGKFTLSRVSKFITELDEQGKKCIGTIIIK